MFVHAYSVQGGRGEGGGGRECMGNSVAFLNPMIIRWWLAGAIDYSV